VADNRTTTGGGLRQAGHGLPMADGNCRSRTCGPMRYRTKRRITTRRLLGTLLAVSIVGLLLPTQITGGLLNLVQVLVPLQAGLTRAADRTAETISSQVDSVSAEEHARLERRAESLRNMVAVQSARIASLEQANRELTGIRERGLGPRGMLIPARVVARDLLGWRQSGLIDAGTLRGVHRGAAVATRSPLLDVGSRDGLTDGMAVLAAEVLVGWVEQAGTHTARVKLLTDPASRMPVTIGRFEQTGFTAVPAEFWMVGAGAGRMKVIEVDHRYVEGQAQAVQTGDLITTLPDDPALPAALTIGTIAEITRDTENGLLYTLTVESAAPQAMRRVYVLDATRR